MGYHTLETLLKKEEWSAFKRVFTDTNGWLVGIECLVGVAVSCFALAFLAYGLVQVSWWMTRLIGGSRPRKGKVAREEGAVKKEPEFPA